jgi:hypothetical protein
MSHRRTSHAAQWADYRQRVRVFWTSFLAIPVAAMVGFGAMAWLNTELPFYILVPAAMVAWLVTGWRMSAWPCPRCGKWFFATMMGRSPFAVSCLHCKLPKWQ